MKNNFFYFFIIFAIKMEYLEDRINRERFIQKNSELWEDNYNKKYYERW
jgi:hypothetical protein